MNFFRLLNLPFILLVLVGIGQIKSAPLTTGSLCLTDENERNSNRHKIKCENPNHRIFITQARYNNDVNGQCNTTLNTSQTHDSSSCVAYETQNLIGYCNGKQECQIELTQRRFSYGFDDSTCDFVATILSIYYECIPSVFTDLNIPRYNVCAVTSIYSNTEGFIHSPNYPDEYDSNTDCERAIIQGFTPKHIEIYLIDMQLEANDMNTRDHYDYLKINSNEMLSGNKTFIFIYNSTSDVTVKFHTDFSNHFKGFLLYFRVQRNDLWTSLFNNTTTYPFSTTSTRMTRPYMVSTTEETTSNRNIMTVYSGQSVCLTDQNDRFAGMHKIKCQNRNHRIFITLARYTNNYQQCNEIMSTLNSPKCEANQTQELIDLCNGKQECLVKLIQLSFNYGYNDSTCDFIASMVSIDYECIPSVFTDQTISRYNVCTRTSISYPTEGFIYSPNYPLSYPANKYCLLTIESDMSVKRIEIFLIEMDIEPMSIFTGAHYDYLRIQNNIQLSSNKAFMVVYNDSSDVTITFKTDGGIHHQGFLLYFRAIKKDTSFDPLRTTIRTYTPRTENSLTWSNQARNTDQSNYQYANRSSSTENKQPIRKDSDQSQECSSNNPTKAVIIFLILVVISNFTILALVIKYKYTKRNRKHTEHENMNLTIH